jgi:type VI secretion system protein VasD
MKNLRRIQAASLLAPLTMAPLFAVALTLAGCAAGSIAGAAMELAGLRKPPELPELQKPPRQIAIHLHAGGNLNAGADGQPLALAARVYKLRQSAAFERASYGGFLNPQTERELLGADLVDVKEVQLIPGQRYDVVESVGREAAHIGVVALFRKPAPQRWRAAFSASEAEISGITIGLHACALTVQGQPLVGTRCQP